MPQLGALNVVRKDTRNTAFVLVLYFMREWLLNLTSSELKDLTFSTLCALHVLKRSRANMRNMFLVHVPQRNRIKYVLFESFFVTSALLTIQMYFVLWFTGECLFYCILFYPRVHLFTFPGIEFREISSSPPKSSNREINC